MWASTWDFGTVKKAQSLSCSHAIKWHPNRHLSQHMRFVTIARLNATNRQYTRFWCCDEGLCRFASALKFHFLAQMVIGCHLWERKCNIYEQRRLMRVCTFLPGRLSLGHSTMYNGTKISCWQFVCHYASSEGSTESAYLRTLTRAFGIRQCDKYHNLLF